MRLAIRASVVVICVALAIAGGLSLNAAADNRGNAARAATVVEAGQPTQQQTEADDEQREPERDGRDDDRPATGAAADRARQAAEAAVSGGTAREVEREAGDDDNPASAWEVELVRPNGATVEVDLDAAFKVLATDRDDDRRNDD